MLKDWEHDSHTIIDEIKAAYARLAVISLPHDDLSVAVFSEIHSPECHHEDHEDHGDHHHPLFEMGNALDFGDVAGTLFGIIFFSIVLEKGLHALHHWIDFFNPLLKPCIEKVTNELMILGAISFTLTISEEIYSFKEQPWAHTLHLIDVIVFLFAFFYVLMAFYILWLVDVTCAWVGVMDAGHIGDILDDIRKADPHMHSNYFKLVGKKKERCDPVLKAEVAILLREHTQQQEEDLASAERNEFEISLKAITKTFDFGEKYADDQYQVR
jgi:hypothetical protein